MKFENKVVIVTGAAGGIGGQTAKAFYDEGAKVVLVDLSEEGLKETAKKFDFADDRTLLVTCDVSKEDQVINYVNKTVEKFGRIDVFFNNAGISSAVAKIAENSSANFEKVMSININGSFYGLKHVLQVMRKQKSGAVVNTSSCAGVRGMPELSTYATSKFAVTGMTRSAALEVASENIRINAIAPAYINTKMMRNIECGCGGEDKQEETYHEFCKVVPMQRYGEAKEVANAVLFLASDEASFITGALLPIDGGYIA
ncbi:MAG: SDR family oxidoreductase [Oscillospiraceae bacterium]|jgi:NAD(P)-dependent dehydrogenase (short-subunit alcohol dehydrogenase family)|nr:SDR family oxidoreductase [Oscillospiraceae bacterium]